MVPGKTANQNRFTLSEVIQREDVEVVKSRQATQTSKSTKGNLSKTNLPNSVSPNQLPFTLKSYQRVSIEMQKLTNVKKISNFLLEETQSRKVNRKLSLTKKLDQSDWRALREEVKKQIANCPNDHQSKKFVKDLRKVVNFWILYPELKGAKPANWKTVLESLGQK